MMSDLIRREDVIKILSQRAEILRGEYGDLGGACSGALKIIKAIPSAEPERMKATDEEYSEYSKVIRCKDCKFYTPMNRILKTGICSMTMHHLGDDGFCSNAEKKKTEGA